MFFLLLSNGYVMTHSVFTTNHHSSFIQQAEVFCKKCFFIKKYGRSILENPCKDIEKGSKN